jgi:hypothetical protein
MRLGEPLPSQTSRVCPQTKMPSRDAHPQDAQPRRESRHASQRSLSGTITPSLLDEVLGVGLLSGGYAACELERAGAYWVYEDPSELLSHIEELGIPTE